jgi:hypothetical protein
LKGNIRVIPRFSPYSVSLQLSKEKAGSMLNRAT